MRKVIPLIEFLKEVSFIFDIYITKTEVFCKLFKDNKSCIAVAESSKSLPRKKYISIKYHNFQSLIQKKMIQICYIDTLKQTLEFSLSHLTNHYAYIYKDNYLDGDLKSETFSLTRGVIRIQRTNQTKNYHNLLDLSGS